MEISSLGSSLEALNAINTDQSAYTTTEAQLSSGLSVQTAAENPTAYAQVTLIQQALSQQSQYTSSSNAAQGRLSIEQQSLTSITNALQSINELAVEANSGSLTASDETGINAQITSDIQSIVGFANAQDSNGEYVFAGNATNTQPYTTNASGAVTYNGDANTRVIQIGPTQYVQDGDAGSSVFGAIPTGNGTFATSAASTNTGTGIVGASTVTDASQWVPDTYQIQFISPTAYNVVNSQNAVVSSGTYTSGTSTSGTSGQAIAFDGVSVTISGVPATGDSFTVSPSTKQDLFTTLNNLVATIGSAPSSAAQKAQFASNLGASIQQLSQAISHINDASATVGGRLQQITANTSNQGAINTALQTTLSQTQDLDYASAVTQMNLQYTALQAAEESYSKFSQLSLFNYLT
jgi:flagellar hook-associated protein 3 FlgL